MTFLGGDAAALFGELFGDEYLAATMTRDTTDFVEGKPRRTVATQDVRVQVDAATERMVGTEGYTASDRAIFVLAAGVDGVDSDCRVQVTEGPFAGDTYRLATPIDRDPAGAYWRARGVRQDG